MESASLTSQRPLVLSAPRRKTATTLLAIATTAVGTLAAILLIPKESAEPGAMFASALALSIGLLVIPLASVMRDPKSILRADYLLALAPIYWLLLDLLQGVYTMESIDRPQISQGFLAIGVFVCMVWLGSLRRPWPVPRFVLKSVSTDFSPNTYFGVAILSFLIGMLKFAVPCGFDLLLMFSYVGQDRWATPWARGQLGGWDAFLDHLEYFGYLLPVLTIILTRYVGWRSLRTVACIGMSLVIALFIAQSGSRRVLGVVIGMALILWVLSQPHLRVKQFIITIVAIVLILLTLQIMLEYRNRGLGSLVGQQSNSAAPRVEKEAIFEEQYLRVDDNFYRLCQIIQLIPESYPFVYHRYFFYVLVRPIPRVFWENKPIDPGFDLPSALGVQGVTYSYSVIGEFYMSLGLLGVALGGWFYGRIAAMANGLLLRCHTIAALLVYSIVVMALFAGLRSILDLILVSYVVLAWVALSHFFRMTSEQRT